MSEVIEGTVQNTGLVVIQPAGQLATQPEVEDNGNWGDDAEEIRPQWIQIRQPSTENADHVPVGSFFHKASGQVWSEINMVILKITKGMAWKPSAPKFVKGEKVVCRSVNRKVPITGQGLIPQSKDCKTCSKNSWKGFDKATGLGDKPLCAKDTFILFIDKETELPYIYDATGKAVAPADALKDAMYQQSLLIKAKSGKMPSSFDYIVTVSTVKEGKNYIPKFTKIAKMTPEAAAKFGPLYEQFVLSRANNDAATDEPTDTVDAEDTGVVDEVTEI